MVTRSRKTYFSQKVTGDFYPKLEVTADRFYSIICYNEKGYILSLGTYFAKGTIVASKWINFLKFPLS